jgi:hypothetical protein
MAVVTAPSYPYILASYASHQVVKGPTSSTLAPDYPAATNVRSGVHYANLAMTGNMTEPAVTDVKTGVHYGANGTEFTGSLVSSGGNSGWSN